MTYQPPREFDYGAAPPQPSTGTLFTCRRRPDLDGHGFCAVTVRAYGSMLRRSAPFARPNGGRSMRLIR
jgi:hypothetical protein